MKPAKIGGRLPALIVWTAMVGHLYGFAPRTVKSAAPSNGAGPDTEALTPPQISHPRPAVLAEMPAGNRPMEFTSDAGQEMAFTLEGKITEQSAGKLTVSTEQNIVFHVSYNEKTEITRDGGGQASAVDLRVGAQIKVDGELAESGEIKARKIVIEKSQKSAAFGNRCTLLSIGYSTGSRSPDQRGPTPVASNPY